MIESRLQALRQLLAQQKLDAVVVTKEVNLYYFSGFRGDDTTLVITADKALLVTDNRYTEQAGLQAPLFELVEQKEGLLKVTADVIKKLGCKRVGFEGNAMTFDTYHTLQQALPEVDFTTSLNLDLQRTIKDEQEISYIREACRIADAAFEDIVKYMHAGMTELEVAARLEQVMRREGSEKPSFDTIVASGLRGSLPHGTATDKKLEPGDFVTMDYGAKYKGYCSDTTRTVVIGQPSDRQREVYAAVLDTQEKVLTAIRPGKSGREIDALSRENLHHYDLDQYFGHGLGHSLGLEIHEAVPRFGKMGRNADELLQPNMLVTDEPGVYLPGWGGLRIEDTVLVTVDGCERLTKSSKKLVEIQ
ncbi:MAG: Xaa-Pro peptidase family protein [Selenomonadaceae bacterium]|nr:Xaa-Pro peptidase family protein [Selenomonadaceae bacterium]